MNRNIVALFALIITLTATIFYFMQNDRNTAVVALFIGIYITVTLFIMLRILFYFRYKATLNELYFVLYFNIIATILILLEPYIPFSADHQFSTLISLGKNNNIHLYITLISFMALPYFLVSTILQVRSFTKYEFFRWSPTSEKGFKAEWVALLVYFIFGAIFTIVGLASNDLLAVIFGVYFIFNGFSYFLGI